MLMKIDPKYSDAYLREKKLNSLLNDDRSNDN